MSFGGRERRRHPRVQGAFDLTLQGPESSERVRVKDISASGICCYTEKPMSEMSVVQLDLMLPHGEQTQSACCKGAVVRCEPATDAKHPTYEVAIFFTELGDEARELLTGYVSSQIPSTV